MKKEIWRHLPKTKLPSRYDRLVKLISWLNDPNHDGVQVPGIGVMGKIG
jgi:hypothetical protein